MGDPENVVLPAGTLLIADLHLDAADPTAGQGFGRFLAAAAGRPALVILGDLFDAWVGPAHGRLSGAAAVVQALRRLTDEGTVLYVVPGNRDFLLDRWFERETGARLAPEGLLCAAGPAARLLCVHGDELCTRDLAYQRLKRVVRSGAVRWLAPRLPGSLALGVARRLRRASTQAVARKPAETKLQQTSEVLRLSRKAGAQTLICGHAHVFRDERLEHGIRWVVLDAWGRPRRGRTPRGGRALLSRLQQAPARVLQAPFRGPLTAGSRGEGAPGRAPGGPWRRGAPAGRPMGGRWAADGRPMGGAMGEAGGPCAGPWGRRA
ncbi:MAG: UDP-2,3-diacylglucosamine diphosphatase [Planctomycetes bacterium]|nr:UDP-2,3-diacylglucosamine diphosphatase [Planctomycetota bacterium]